MNANKTRGIRYLGHEKMKMTLLNAFLVIYILSYLVFVISLSALNKKERSFVESFDRSAIRGGVFFALMSGLTMVTAIADNFTLPFI